jgi:hypothetical protein
MGKMVVSRADHGCVEIRVPALGPGVRVVDLALLWRPVAARPDAAVLNSADGDALSATVESAASPEVEDS